MTKKELAFKFFDSMVSGQTCTIKEIAKKDPEAFKEYIKAYIDSGGNMTVNSNWTKFRKDADISEFKDVSSLVKKKEDGQ